jgi:antitoxin (DNA-binding transcriptional repressor) of toxin-antitoxin stability system
MNTNSIPLAQAHADLPSIIHNLKPGDAVVITEGDQPVARLVAEAVPVRKPRVPGSMIGKLTIISDDDEHLEDFREYME